MAVESRRFVLEKLLEVRGILQGGVLNRLVPLRAPFDERSWSRKKSGSNEEDLSMTDHFWIQLR